VLDKPLRSGFQAPRADHHLVAGAKVPGMALWQAHPQYIGFDRDHGDRLAGLGHRTVYGLNLEDAAIGRRQDGAFRQLLGHDGAFGGFCRDVGLDHIDCGLRLVDPRWKPCRSP
jgi:hypothetical protein